MALNVAPSSDSSEASADAPSLSNSPALGINAGFSSADAWGFLKQLEATKHLYGEESKRADRLEAELAAKDAQLQDS